jgi:hypothetical protein
MPTASACPATDRHASAFKEKPNNPYKRGSNETKNTAKDIHRMAHCISQNVQCLNWAKISLQKLRPKMPQSTLSHLSFIILVVAFNIFQLRIGLRVSFDVFLRADSFCIHDSLGSSTFAIASGLWLKQHFTS